MFREMRLKECELPEGEAVEILVKNSYGVLALDGDGGYTYAVPVNYTYEDNKIYFHGAIEGHKFDSVANNDKVSFCVVDRGEVIAEEFNTLYRSAIIFGKICILEDDNERSAGLEALIRRFSPDYMEKGKASIEKEWNVVAVFKIDVERLTAKKGI